MVGKFYYLKTGLGVVLAFVGVKMLLAHTPFRIDTLPALGVVAGVLAVSIAASLLHQPRKAASALADLGLCPPATTNQVAD